MKNIEFMESIKEYDAPQVEIIEVKVEKGFAVSSNIENVKMGKETGW